MHFIDAVQYQCFLLSIYVQCKININNTIFLLLTEIIKDVKKRAHKLLFNYYILLKCFTSILHIYTHIHSNIYIVIYNYFQVYV